MVLDASGAFAMQPPTARSQLEHSLRLRPHNVLNDRTGGRPGQATFDDKPGEKRRIRAAGGVVSSWNGEERACVVDEAGTTGEPSGLCCGGAKPRHGVGRIQKPPGRPDVHAWIEPCQWRYLSRVRRLIDREQHEVEISLESEAFEEWAQSPHEVSSAGNVMSGIGTVLPEGVRAVIADNSCVESHDKAILDAHLRHLQKHVPTEGMALSFVRPTGKRILEQHLRIYWIDIDDVRDLDTVVGRDRPMTNEMRPPGLQRREVPLE